MSFSFANFPLTTGSTLRIVLKPSREKIKKAKLKICLLIHIRLSMIGFAAFMLLTGRNARTFIFGAAGLHPLPPSWSRVSGQVRVAAG